MSGDRNSIAESIDLISDPDERARREAENGVRQFKLALEIIRNNIAANCSNFKLKQSLLLDLHREALDGIHPLSGTYRNSRVFIDQSTHIPPKASDVADHVADMCNYVNENWSERSACHLSAYLMWRINWIHPFADGNGRTARVVSYVIMSIKLNALLPGNPTIPDMIASNKNSYYEALEKADQSWRVEEFDISAMEKLMERLLENQLQSAVREAWIA